MISHAELNRRPAAGGGLPPGHRAHPSLPAPCAPIALLLRHHAAGAGGGAGRGAAEGARQHRLRRQRAARHARPGGPGRRDCAHPAADGCVMTWHGILGMPHSARADVAPAQRRCTERFAPRWSRTRCTRRAPQLPCVTWQLLQELTRGMACACPDHCIFPHGAPDAVCGRGSAGDGHSRHGDPLPVRPYL